MILACLFNLDSYEVPGIIDTSGMTVDWIRIVRTPTRHSRRNRIRDRRRLDIEDIRNDLLGRKPSVAEASFLDRRTGTYAKDLFAEDEQSEGDKMAGGYERPQKDTEPQQRAPA